MDEEKTAIALSFWTREDEDAISWSHLLAKHHIKFTMTAYNEGIWRDLTIFMFRLEPIPEEKTISYLQSHGFTNPFYVYKNGEKSDDRIAD